MKDGLLNVFERITAGERVGQLIIFTETQAEELLDSLFVLAETLGVEFNIDTSNPDEVNVSVVDKGAE